MRCINAHSVPMRDMRCMNARSVPMRDMRCMNARSVPMRDMRCINARSVPMRAPCVCVQCACGACAMRVFAHARSYLSMDARVCTLLPASQSSACVAVSDVCGYLAACTKYAFGQSCHSTFALVLAQLLAH